MIGHVANELRHHKFREDCMDTMIFTSSPPWDAGEEEPRGPILIL